MLIIQQNVTGRPFRVKICGLTRPEDARCCAVAGADAIGLNFYSGSPRFLTLSRAAEICERLPAEVARVGVFVNAPPEQILETARQLPLDWIQLHGDEPPETAARLAPWPVVRAFRCQAGGGDALLEQLQLSSQAGACAAAVLVDAYQPGAFGGTGHTVDWSAAAGLVSRLAPLPLILAGGLRPENVADAIRAVRPWAVDTASGVESAPGRKDPQRVEQFVRQARAAFAE